MHICENCFNDEELKTSIRNHNHTGVCDFCGAQNVYTADIDEFNDFFVELLSLFKKDATGADVVSVIQTDWNLFSNVEFASSVLEYFINKTPLPYTASDKVKYIEAVNEYTDKWAELKEEIQHKTRFYSSLMSYFENNGFLLNSNLKLKPGDFFYRARIVPSGKSYLTKKDMGCPPPSKATAGRANPIGIPYLYLCKIPETTLYETRSVYLDKVSIGTFAITRDINILDFTASISLYLAYNEDIELSESIAKYKLRQQISADLSKPLRRYDTELEYVPTQSICEYCKLKYIDGIIFRSSLHKNGFNLVLFNEDCAKCIKVKTIEVSKVEISMTKRHT